MYNLLGSTHLKILFKSLLIQGMSGKRINSWNILKHLETSWNYHCLSPQCIVNSPDPAWVASGLAAKCYHQTAPFAVSWMSYTFPGGLNHWISVIIDEVSIEIIKTSIIIIDIIITILLLVIYSYYHYCYHYYYHHYYHYCHYYYYLFLLLLYYYY